MTDTQATARLRFEALLTELAAVETALGRTASGDTYYITDGNIDEENARDAGFAIESAEYWNAAYDSARSAAGSRCEDYGLDINKLIGRAIY